MQTETAAVEAPSSAFCAEHPDAPSQGTCPRCGQFVCGRCMIPTSEVCLACQRRQLQELPSAEPRVRWAARALKLRAGIAIAAVALDAWMLSRLEDGSPSMEDAERFDGVTLLLALPMVLSIVVSAILFLRWLHLAVKTANTLGLSQESTAWAMWVWFIPVVNLIKPFQVVRGLWRSLGGPAGEGLLQAWWAVWVISNLGNRASTQLSNRVAEDASLFASSLVADLLVETLILLGALLCIRVMRDVQALLGDRVADFTRAPAEEALTVRD